jgi:hypothetical protein
MLQRQTQIGVNVRTCALRTGVNARKHTCTYAHPTHAHRTLPKTHNTYTLIHTHTPHSLLIGLYPRHMRHTHLFTQTCSHTNTHTHTHTRVRPAWPCLQGVTQNTQTYTHSFNYTRVCVCVLPAWPCLQDVTQDTASRFPILYQETMTVGRRHFLITQLKWLIIVSTRSYCKCPQLRKMLIIVAFLAEINANA